MKRQTVNDFQGLRVSDRPAFFYSGFWLLASEFWIQIDQRKILKWT